MPMRLARSAAGLRPGPCRSKTMAGWPKRPGPEQVSHHIYPYDLSGVLDSGQAQEIDIELNT